MISFFRTAFALGTLFCLTNCMELQLEINVQEDGSGIVIQSVAISQAAVTMRMEALKQEGRTDLTEQAVVEEMAKRYMDRDKLLAQAKLMRATFDGADLFKAKSGGYVAATRFKFDDINQLRAGGNSATALLSGATPATAGEDGNPYTFSFEPGEKSSTLKVNVPQTPAASAEKESTPKANPTKTPEQEARQQMLKNIYGSARIAAIVQVDGKILQTTGKYHLKNAVTLGLVEFGKMIEDEVAFGLLQKEMQAQRGPTSFPEFFGRMANKPGVILEPAKEIVITFEGSKAPAK